MPALTVHARSPRSPRWQRLHVVADRQFPALRALFNQAWRAMAATLDVDLVSRALQEQNLPAILVLLEDAWARSTDATVRAPLRELLQGLVVQGAEVSQAALPGVRPPALAVAFGAAHPLVLDFVQRHSAELIRDIGIETRQAIRSMLLAQMEAGKGWQSLVPQISAVVGVTRRQAEALEALRARATAQGMKAAQVEQLVSSQARTYKRLRARTIARHESLSAVNAGSFLHTQALVSTGVMDPTQYRRHVIVTRDDRLCQYCTDVKALNPDGVALLQAFQTPDGPHMHPPWHVL